MGHHSGFVIGLLPTAVDGRYDLAAYRAVFALQGGLILLVCSFYFGSRDPLKKVVNGKSVLIKTSTCLLLRLVFCAVRGHLVAVR